MLDGVYVWDVFFRIYVYSLCIKMVRWERILERILSLIKKHIVAVLAVGLYRVWIHYSCNIMLGLGIGFISTLGLV